MQKHVPAHADPSDALARIHRPVWTSRKKQLAIASVIIAASLGLGGASVAGHRVGAAPAQTPAAGTSSAAPNSGLPLAGSGTASNPSLPVPPTSSPGRPSRTPEPKPAAPSAPQLAADGIPAVALDAYRKAAAHLAITDPGCGLPWPLLAAIGRVESDHGRFAGSQLYTDGTDAPRVIGIPLNGHGTALILDTDHGVLDGDTVYDHAVGPMQFIPSTWATWGVDGNGDGVASPFNIYDAALAAADYLCSAGGNLQTAGGQIRAVLAYNDSDAYLATVLALEKLYAAGQPGVTIPILPSLPKPPPNEAPLPPPVNPGPPLALTTAPKSPSKAGSGPGSTSGPGSPSQPGSVPGAPPGSGSTTGPGSPPGGPGSVPSWPRTTPPASAPPPGSSSATPPPTDSPPTADLSVAATAGGGPLDVTADASGSTDDKPGLTYTFDFGDGTTAAVVGPQSAATATYTYASAGTYAVKVTVTDSAGQTSTKTQDITVTAPAVAAASSSGTTSGGATPGTPSQP